MKHTNIRRKVITTVILLAVGILFLLPLLWMISSSLKPGSEVFSTNFTWIPSKFVWKTYEQVLTSKSVPFLNMIKNSLVLATATIVGQLLVSSLAAYAFACIDFKGKNIVFIMLLGAMMIPSQATLIPRFTLSTLWACIIPTGLCSCLPGSASAPCSCCGSSIRRFPAIWWRPPLLTAQVTFVSGGRS